MPFIPLELLQLRPYGLYVTVATLLFGCTFGNQQPGQCDDRDDTDDYHNQHNFQQCKTFVSLSQITHHFFTSSLIEPGVTSDSLS
jgi:hypothetical protein